MEPGDNRLHQQLQSARERLQDLYRRAEASPAQRELLEEALAELSISLEELQVSVEEMRQYNDELAAAQEETAVEHRRYRELFDFAPAGYLVTDPWGNIQDANRQAKEILGVFQEYLAHKPMITFIADRDHKRFRDLLAKLLTDDLSGEWETEILRRRNGGAPFPATLSVFRVCDPQGRLIRLLWLVRNITERKKAEDVVQQSLRRVIALRDINDAIMSTLDLQQVLDFLLEKIEQFFPYPIASTVRLFNRDKRLEYLACRNIKDEDWKNYQPGSPGALGQEVVRTKAPLFVRNIQTDSRIIRRPDFYRRNNLVSYLAAPLMTKGEVLGLLCVYTKAEHEFSDQEIAFLSGVGSQAALAIYNSRLYEQLKEQSLELRKAHDELIILGLSQEMRLGLERSDPHYESITAIEQEALRCRKIVLDLFDFVRPKEATFTPVDVGETLHKTSSLLSVQCKKSNIKTVVDLEPDLPPIFADPQQLRQVLINLSFNAAEAMADGGTLAFRAAANRVAAKDHSGNDEAQFELTIAICDTGPGIGPEVLPDIFRPFFSTKKGKGMGLGLSICERIMKAHRGRISVESRPGEGTTFYLHFPVPEMKE